MILADTLKSGLRTLRMSSRYWERQLGRRISVEQPKQESRARNQVRIRLSCHRPLSALFFRLECASVDIFSVSYLYNNDNKLIVFDTVDNAVSSLPYTIPIVAGQFT